MGNEGWLHVAQQACRRSWEWMWDMCRNEYGELARQSREQVGSYGDELVENFAALGKEGPQGRAWKDVPVKVG